MRRKIGEDPNEPKELAVLDAYDNSLPAQWEASPVAPLPESQLQPATQLQNQPAPIPPIHYSQPVPDVRKSMAPVQQVHLSPTQIVNVNVNAPVMPLVVTAPAGPPLIMRVLWYVFVGWWLSEVVIVLGYALMLTIIGIPAAFALFNRIPQALTLRPRTTRYVVEMRDGVTYLTNTIVQQRPWYWRALYFIFIGWWFGAVWLVAAWLIGLLILTLPLTFLMYNRTSAVMTLQRH